MNAGTCKGIEKALFEVRATAVAKQAKLNNVRKQALADTRSELRDAATLSGADVSRSLASLAAFDQQYAKALAVPARLNPDIPEAACEQAVRTTAP